MEVFSDHTLGVPWPLDSLPVVQRLIAIFLVSTLTQQSETFHRHLAGISTRHQLLTGVPQRAQRKWRNEQSDVPPQRLRAGGRRPVFSSEIRFVSESRRPMCLWCLFRFPSDSLFNRAVVMALVVVEVPLLVAAVGRDSPQSVYALVFLCLSLFLFWLFL